MYSGQEKNRQSYGLVVQYEYLLDEVESNNQLYLSDGTVKLSDSLLHEDNPFE